MFLYVPLKSFYDYTHPELLTNLMYVRLRFADDNYLSLE